MGDEPISFRHMEEATIQTKPTPPTTFSPRKHRLPSRNDVISTPKNPKKLAVISAENRGVIKSELLEVIYLIQNTMQTLSAFEKRCSVQ